MYLQCTGSVHHPLPPVRVAFRCPKCLRHWYGCSFRNLDYGIWKPPVLLETAEGKACRKAQAEERAQWVARAKEKARRKAIAKQKSLDTEAQGARTRTTSVKTLMEPAVATWSRPEGSALSLSDLGRTEPVFFPDIEHL